MTPYQEAAALHGWATNAGVSLHERLAAALQALDYYSARLEAVESLCELAERGGAVMVPTVTLRNALDGDR